MVKSYARFGTWVVFIAAVVILAYLRWPGETWLKTGFETLLPGSSSMPWVSKANRQSSKGLEDQLLLMTQGPAERRDDLLELLDRARESLIDAGYVDADFETNQIQRWQALVRTLFPYRHGLMAREDAELLADDPGEFLDRYRRKLYSPLGASLLNSLQTDPAGLFNGFIQSLVPEQVAPGVDETDPALAFEFTLLRVRQDRLGFSELAGLYGAYTSLRQEALESGLILRATGVPLYSAYGVQSGQKELSTIGLASFGLLILLLALVLRSVTGLLLSVLCVSTALLCGLLLTVSLLGQIHILTLVFGATLIGIAVDYAFHYLAHSLMPDWRREDALGKVFRGLSLGFLSSSLAFSVLLFLPFPGIRQMGLFMVSGLLGAWLSVCLLFPAVYIGPGGRANIPSFCFRTRFGVRYRIAALLLLLVLIIPGIMRLEARDNVKDFYAAPPELQQDTEAITQRLGGPQETRYFLLQADSMQALLEKEETLLQAADRLQESGEISLLTGITRLIPSIRTQRVYFDQTSDLVLGAHLVEHLEKIGLSAHDQQAIRSTLTAEFEPATPELLNGMKLPMGAGGFLGCAESGCASWVQVVGSAPPSTLEALTSHLDGVRLVDQLGDINALMREYRTTLLYVLLASVVIAGMLLSLTAGWRRGVSIMTLPVLSCLFAVAVNGFLTGNWSIINILALFLVIGVSLDFAIFRAFTSENEQPATSLAITLSAATSILAFGMLSFSSTPLISAFGLTITAGMIFAYVFSWFHYDRRGE